MARRIRQRRTQLDRPGIADRTGAAEATVNSWYQHRHRTGFPAKADTDRTGRDWWWLHDIDTFHTAYQAARLASYTTIDRSGDPDDLLTAPEAARLLGYVDHRSLTPALRNHPDHTEELPGGGLRRFWYRRTVWAYADTRPDRHSAGRPAGLTDPRSPAGPYANDPRLRAARLLLRDAAGDWTNAVRLGPVLAAQLSISDRTAQRLLAAARDSILDGP